MARYTGPKVRVTRRLGVNIFENEKGRKALERRPFPPGAHGRTRRRNAGSEYLAQLQAKLYQAQRDWERAQQLGPSDALAANQFDAYKAGFDQARANVACFTPGTWAIRSRTRV